MGHPIQITVVLVVAFVVTRKDVAKGHVNVVKAAMGAVMVAMDAVTDVMGALVKCVNKSKKKSTKVFF